MTDVQNFENLLKIYWNIVFKYIRKLRKNWWKGGYGVLRGFSLGGFAPQTPHQGGSAPLDPPKYGPVTPQDGLVTPPLWRLRADLFKKRPKSLKNVSFSRFFHQGAQIGCKSRKTGFYVFCLFTPLYWRFRLSRASQTIDIEKIYRLVSKILNFMPCGSVLGRFCVQCKNFVAWASKFYRTSMEILTKSYVLNTKTDQYRATRHEIENFWYQSIDLFNIYRLRGTAEPETAI